MFQSFITSLDNSQPVVKFKKEELAPKERKLGEPGWPRNPTREVTRKDPLLPNDASSLKSGSHERLKLAIEEEIALRNRLRHYNSTDKLSKKQDILKKRVEKAKSMNKRALKVYKNYKEKEEKSYDFFKIETLYNSSQTEMIKPAPARPHFKKFINQSEHSQAQGNSLETLKIPHDGVNTSQCRTAGVKTRTRCIFDSQSQSIIKRFTSNDRFLDYKRKEQQTREKKMELQRTKEEQSLYRLIKKNERLNELELKHQQEQEQQFKKLQKLRQQSLLKQTAQQQFIGDLDISIREKCQEKAIRKELQLKEQANRLRQDFRAKQERREKHRTNMLRQHNEKTSLNELRRKEQIERRQASKENDHRHQMTIRQRHQMLKQKEHQAKMINILRKLTDSELQASIKRLSNPANLNSPKPICNTSLI